jgi:hypothetical protein
LNDRSRLIYLEPRPIPPCKTFRAAFRNTNQRDPAALNLIGRVFVIG